MISYTIETLILLWDSTGYIYMKQSTNYKSPSIIS